MNKSLSELCRLSFWLRLFQSFIETFQRFPLPVIALVIIDLVVLDDIHDFNLFTNQQESNIILSAIVGMFWFTSSTLLAESLQCPKIRFYQIALPIFLIYCGYVYSIQNSWPLSSWTLIVAAGLCITFSAWLFRDSDNPSVWYFNYQLISALCFALLSGLILCGGISLILTSIMYLFELKLRSPIYGDTWLIGMTLFTPIYFLSRIPTQFDYPYSECQFPKGIHFILTYVLVPLSLIYMVILYAYFIKILLQFELPHGHLGTMISWFGVIGIITHLAIYPIHDKGNKLLNWFYRYFYLIMIVPLGLLCLVIGIRLSQYGITEQRYIVVLCTLWFAILIISFLLKPQHFRLQQVTISLALITLIASFGPWGIQQLPVNNQFSRLQTLLIKENLLIDGNLKVTQQPDFNSLKTISSIVEYLVSHNAGNKIRPWIQDKQAFDKKLVCAKSNSCRRHDGKLVVELMNIDFVNPWQQPTDSRYSEISLKNLNNITSTGSIFTVTGYDFFIPISRLSKNVDRFITLTDDNEQSTKFTLKLNNQGLFTLSTTDNDNIKINFDLLKLAAQFPAKRSTYIEADQANKLILIHNGRGLSGKLYINRLQIRDKKVISLSGRLLLKKLLM